MRTCGERTYCHSRFCEVHKRFMDNIFHDAKRCLSHEDFLDLKETIVANANYASKLISQFINWQKTQIPGKKRRLFNPHDWLEDTL